MIRQMIAELCDNSEQKCKKIEEISIQVLEKCIGLWNAIVEQTIVKIIELLIKRIF